MKHEEYLERKIVSFISLSDAKKGSDLCTNGIYNAHIFLALSLHIPYGIKGNPVSPPCQVPWMIRVLGFKDCILNTERPKVNLPQLE